MTPPVFNVDQIEGLPDHYDAPETVDINPEQRIARIDAIDATKLSEGARIDMDVVRTAHALALEGLGRHTKRASALLIMAIAGGAVLPQLYAHLASLDAIGYRGAYAMIIPCYLFIAYYGWLGHRIRHWGSNK